MRSGLERSLDAQLKHSGVSYGYEVQKIDYTISHKYIVDFTLENGIAIEAKGYFRPGEAAKYRAVKYQNPDLDLRFVFSNAHARIPGQKTTYAQWCDRHGFPWGHMKIPEEWLKE